VNSNLKSADCRITIEMVKAGLLIDVVGIVVVALLLSFLAPLVFG